MASVGIVGASGFTGAELLRLLAQHPEFEVKLATGDTQAGRPLAALYPSLAAAYGATTFTSFDPAAVDGLDVVFCGLPHGASAYIVPQLIGRAGVVVDLSADFRLHDPSMYPTWYGAEHPRPDLLERFAFGLPELFGADLKGATAIAAPGCYVTTAALALAPLLKGGLADPNGIIVDAASGVSGAGRAPKANTTFCAVDENLSAYALEGHRHGPEMEQALSEASGTDVSLLFTPHLAPMNRGILATCHARPTTGADSPTTASLLAAYREFYADQPFVVVTDDSPQTKATLGSNSAHITVRVDERTGWISAIGALDNLVKGASGQAIQCANIATGRDQTMGLPLVGMMP